MKDAKYASLGKEKKFNKQLRQVFHPSAAAVHPSLLGPHCLIKLLQKELVAFSIPTCGVAPLMSPRGHGACFQKVKFAANCIILPKTCLSKSSLAAESCADSLQLLGQSYFCLKRKRKEKAKQLLANFAILYARVSF